MASLAKSRLIVKNLTPEEVGRALAEFVTVRAGLNLNRRCRVKTDYIFKHGQKLFDGARVEIELL